MKVNQIKYLMLVSLTSIFFMGCALQKKAAQPKIAQFPQAKFLDVYKIPNGLHFQGTRVGGLSSIDFNAERNEFYFICDDRSALHPARYYTANINLLYPKIKSVQFTKVDTLKDEKGHIYQPFTYFEAHPELPFNTPDPEELRYNSKHKTMVWSSEGERILGKNQVLLNPSIQVIAPDGQLKNTYPIPSQLQMTAEDFGPRRNGVLEGLSFTPDDQNLFASLEEPLLQDGPSADVMDQETWCRILKYDAEKQSLLSQFAYPLGKVIRKPIPGNAFKVNGISSILAVDATHILVVERSFSMGYLQSNVRVYWCDISAATDIKNMESLKGKTNQFKAATKTLVINFDTLGVFVDNVEGITFGPKLPNGHETLLFVTDNNFNKIEKQQIFWFELIP